MTGYMKISAMDQADVEGLMPGGAGLQVETRFRDVSPTDKVGVVMSAMQSLEFTLKDKMLLLAVLMDVERKEHAEMVIRMPMTEEG